MFGYTEYKNGGIRLVCEDDLGKYYRSLFLLTFGIKLQSPMHGSHIMLTFREDGLIQNPIARYCLEFELDRMLFTNGNAFWLNVSNNNSFYGLKFFRQRMGLGKAPIDFHYCIGYKRNGSTTARSLVISHLDLPK